MRGARRPLRLTCSAQFLCFAGPGGAESDPLTGGAELAVRSARLRGAPAERARGRLWVPRGEPLRGACARAAGGGPWSGLWRPRRTPARGASAPHPARTPHSGALQSRSPPPPRPPHSPGPGGSSSSGPRSARHPHPCVRHLHPSGLWATAPAGERGRGCRRLRERRPDPEGTPSRPSPQVPRGPEGEGTRARGAAS